MSLARIFRSVGFLFLALVSLAGCGGGGGGGSAGPTYTVSGTISGYTATSSGLILRNGTATLPVSSSTSFSFSGVANGSTYAISVSTQPSGPAQTCTVINGSGTVTNANVTNVQVNCVTNTFTISGSVSNLTGNGLVLQNNLGDNLAVSTSNFTFSAPVANGRPYKVTVLAQPTGQFCTVSGGGDGLGGGTMGNANVTNVQISCGAPPPPPPSPYTIGGTISGLTGTGLILQNNGSDNLALSPTSASSTFAFNTAITNGGTYVVTVLAQPTGQFCTVSGGGDGLGGGTVASANITSVLVSCANIPTYTIGGSVSGLIGGGLVLQNNGGNNRAIGVNGGFTFSTALVNFSGYSVTVFTQPTGQFCTVSGGDNGLGGGTVASASVTNVQVTCVTNTPPPATFTIGGNVSGLLSGRSLVLQNNGGDNRTVAAIGAYAFNTSIPSGGAYSVTVLAQPSGQTCTVANGSGTVASANVTNVQVSCVANRYTVSGNVSGPSGSTSLPGALVLQNNGGDPISLTSYGVFSFPTSVASGQPYSVAVFLQPDPNWTCVPTRASGIIGAANITDVQVSCVDNTVVATNPMGAARNHHTATLLADGKVVVAGGLTQGSAVPLNSADIFDPSGAGAFTAATGSMSYARTNHTATPIAGGKVLVVGGSDGNANLRSAEVFDPAVGGGTFSPTGLMVELARLDHSAALLADGRVLIAGGYGGAGSPVASAEIYDPAANTGIGAFIATAGPMGTVRTAHSATFLPLTGTVLIVGGQDANAELSSAEIFNPAAGGTFSATGAMSAIRRNHTATLLLDGKVLIVGGKQNSNNPIASAEVYDPATGAFHATGSMATARADHTATLLANGKVLVTGGCTGSSCTRTLKTMEIYDPASGLFANAGSMSSERANHTATLLPTPNRVLITGGHNGTVVVNSADIFVPQ